MDPKLREDARPLFVMTGDMVHSRQQGERAELGRRVEEVLVRLNERFAAGLQAPVATTRGIDEISGAWHDPTHAFDLVLQLHLALWPVRFRVVLSRGAVDVGADGEDAGAMDGPAFHAAADHMKVIASEDRDFGMLHDDAPEMARLIEHAASLELALLAAMKPRTVDTLRAHLDRHPDETAPAQAVIAERIQAGTRQAVSDALRRADYLRLARLEETIRTCLSSLPR